MKCRKKKASGFRVSRARLTPCRRAVVLVLNATQSIFFWFGHDLEEKERITLKKQKKTLQKIKK